MREYNEHLHANKLDSIDEIAKFIERHKLLKLTQEEIENLSRLITSKEATNKAICNLTKKFPTKKSQAQMASLVNYQMFREELT